MSTQMELAGGKIRAGIADGVGRVVFNQPEKRNAMSVDMWEGMGQALDRFAEDPAVRCVVLQGAGDKAFVSGADISQFEKNRANADAQREYDRLTGAGRAKLSAFPKPVIAQIRGFCMGGGLGIAMSTDIRIASDDSQFGIPAAKLGIAYGFDMVR
ncbi:MAG: enoyl-CoA hydratase/isomerase family protein, partial [Acetobacteraceae bacterium]|nr:enoyl-CoA hydratase/isomerase family protein [Acetobacteraceae bacterium]